MELSKALSVLNLLATKLGIDAVVSGGESSAYSIRMICSRIHIQGNYTKDFVKKIAFEFPDATFKMSESGYWETNIVFNEINFEITLT